MDTSGNVSSTVSITFYKTTLNANGGSVSPTSVLTKSGNSFTFPTPTRSNYTYVGWSTSSSATSGVKTLSPSSNATYYAVWKTNNTFVWGQDNWNFNNSPSYFSTKTYGTFKYRDLINSTYSNKLKNNLSNTEYQRVFGTYGYINYTWGGSCYGMAVLNVLAKDGIIPYTTYKNGASNLHSLNIPVNDNKVNSLITYYHMLQKKDVIQQLNYKYNNKSNEQIIKELISLLDNNPEVLVCFFTNTWGHAIVATGYEYGSWTYNGITYQGCIKICDPNSSTAYDKGYNIYFNSRTYNWAIPEYYWDGGSSTKGASFGFISADTSILNSGGYHNSSYGNTSTFDNIDESFVARIDAYSISDNRHVSKVRYESGQYTTSYSAPGDIEEDNSYVLAGESSAVAGYNLYDSQSAYRVTQDEHVEMQLSLNYGNCYLMGGSMAGESVLFDKNGYVQVNGESANYNISMTFNDYYPTDWFTIEVSGSNADTVSLKKADSGYVLSANKLEDVQIDCSNRTSISTAKFSTGYDSVFIYEIDENTIGLRVDTDGNGTYETELPTDTFQIGDTNGDGNITISDVTAIQRHLAELELFTDEQIALADTNGDGEINIIDATHLQKYLAEFDGIVLGKQNN